VVRDGADRGGKILLFGNGGSASDAQHLAAEFVNRYDRDRRALAAIALATGRIGRDEHRQRLRLPKDLLAADRGARATRDVAVGITTSGTSPNVLDGLRAARAVGMRTAALLGRDGGEAARLAELALVVPGGVTARVQEVHILAGHLLCERVDDLLAPDRDRSPVTS